MTQEEKMLFGIEIISGMKASLYEFDIEQGRAEAMHETRLEDWSDASEPDIGRKFAVFESQRLVEQAFYVADVTLNYLSQNGFKFENPNVYRFRIGYAEIILEDLAPGCGKIIIADNDRDYNFSFYWGAMGNGYNIKTFLLKLNPPYFAGKLIAQDERNALDVKKTMAAVRKAIREELPWYKFTEFQKELREELNNVRDNLENYPTQQNFVSEMQQFVGRIIMYDGLDFQEEREMKELLEGIVCEPWNFIVNKNSRKMDYLEELLIKIKKHIISESSLRLAEPSTLSP